MMDDLRAIARQIQGDWAKAFARKDWPALVGLYTDRPAFYGSTPELHVTQAALRSYFEALPPSLLEAQYAEPEITPIKPGCFAASGDVVFVNRDRDGETGLAFRMTHVMVRDEGGWRIAVHHASARPGPLLPG